MRRAALLLISCCGACHWFFLPHAQVDDARTRPERVSEASPAPDRALSDRGRETAADRSERADRRADSADHAADADHPKLDKAPKADTGPKPDTTPKADTTSPKKELGTKKDLLLLPDTSGTCVPCAQDGLTECCPCPKRICAPTGGACPDVVCER